MRHDGFDGAVRPRCGEPRADAMTLEPIVEIRTTFASREAADACATRLVAGRFAACVQVDGPIASVYRWRDAIETVTEWRCTCKTAVDRRRACLDAIASVHDYETPEVIAVEVSASPGYAAWVRECASGT